MDTDISGSEHFVVSNAKGVMHVAPNRKNRSLAVTIFVRLLSQDKIVAWLRIKLAK